MYGHIKQIQQRWCSLAKYGKLVFVIIYDIFFTLQSKLITLQNKAL